jgi:hypothetical protein
MVPGVYAVGVQVLDQVWGTVLVSPVYVQISRIATPPVITTTTIYMPDSSSSTPPVIGALAPVSIVADDFDGGRAISYSLVSSSVAGAYSLLTNGSLIIVSSIALDQMVTLTVTATATGGIPVTRLSTTADVDVYPAPMLAPEIADADCTVPRVAGLNTQLCYLDSFLQILVQTSLM